MGFATIDAAFGGGTPDYAGQARKAEAKRQKAINKGMGQIDTAFAGYNPAFYDARTQAYIDFAMPQLSKQYQDTRNQIGFGLANRGLSKSGAAQGQWSNLARAMSDAKQNIADTGRGQSQELQRQVQDARNALVSQLYQSADPASAGANAVSTAASFRAPSVFAPIANQFSGLLNQYYISSMLNQRPATTYNQPLQYGGSLGNSLGPVTYSSSY